MSNCCGGKDGRGKREEKREEEWVNNHDIKQANCKREEEEGVGGRWVTWRHEELARGPTASYAQEWMRLLHKYPLAPPQW